MALGGIIIRSPYTPYSIYLRRTKNVAANFFGPFALPIWESASHNVEDARRGNLRIAMAAVYRLNTFMYAYVHLYIHK